MSWFDRYAADQAELFADFQDPVEGHAIVEPAAMIAVESSDELP